MKITKKIATELTDLFEGALDHCPALDGVTFSIKREAAEKAVQAALAFIRDEVRP